jgi:isopenicillin-N epimerase
MWLLDPEITFLNHGSFGSCPGPVLQQQDAWRRRLEREPISFMVRELEPLLDEARAALAEFVGAAPEDVAFVPNATTGVNAVLRSLELAPGDELLTTDHAYNACRNALEFVARRAGARVVVAAVPFPCASPDDVVEAVLEKVTPATRLALLDHVTSPTGMVLPMERLVAALRERGVESLVDGAHAPGMIDLDVAAIGAAYYTGNCHKWICAPKGAAFLHVRRELQDTVRPVTISHGANATRTDRSRFLVEFDWVGTIDPSPWLTVPAALRFMGSLAPGGWPQLRADNRALALRARELLAETLGQPVPCPDAMIGSLATLPLPDGPTAPRASAMILDPLQERLLAEHRIEVPVVAWPAPPKRWVRISAQVYNELSDYERLAGALREVGVC